MSAQLDTKRGKSLLRLALSENRATFLLAFPMVAGLVAQMMMGWVDMIMVGRLGVGPLAAAAFGTSIVHLFLVFGYGLISSVSVRVSQEFGAQRGRQTGEVLLAGIIFAILSGILMLSLVYLAWPWFGLLGQEPGLLEEAREFLFLLSWSVIPALLTTVAKDYSESLGSPWLPFWVIFGGVGLNAGLNWLLIYGNMGFPALGLAGAGWGTLIARCVVVVILFIIVFRARRFADYRITSAPWARLRLQIGRLTTLGVPAGFHLLAEMGFFTAVTILMGWIGPHALASHQIAFHCASTSFMFPLGLGLAATMRVGRAIGAGEFHRVRPITFGAMLGGWSILCLIALSFLIFGQQIASFVISDPTVVVLATKLLIIAAIFQWFDGTQTISVGVLRGMGDVRIPMLIVYCFYWLIATPIGYWLAFPCGWGAVGLWTGLAIGLGLMALTMAARLQRMTAKASRGEITVPET